MGRSEAATEWIEQALEGDREARDRVSAWFLRQAFRLAYADLAGIPNRETLAEEIAGETSLKAIRHLDRFQAARPLSPWLHQIVRNYLRDHFRRSDFAALPRPVYRRWIHDFLTTHAADLDALIRRELREVPPLLLDRIAADLREKSFHQFVRLSYEGPEAVVLETVKDWLRSFVGVRWRPLYDQDDAGEWIAANLPGPDDTEEQVLSREFIERVNEKLTCLPLRCQRLIRWYYLDRVLVPQIAELEQVHERTVYRRLETCASAFRQLLVADSYFTEFAHGD